MMNMKFTTPRLRYYRAMFYSATVFNLCVSVSFVLAFDRLYPLMGGGDLPEAPLFWLFFQLTAGAILLFGAMYYLVARRPDAEGSGILAGLGIVGKLTFFFVMSGYAMAELIPWGLAAVSFLDLFYSLLFIEYMLYRSAVVKRPMEYV
jgi:hypothetical protein